MLRTNSSRQVATAARDTANTRGCARFTRRALSLLSYNSERARREGGSGHGHDARPRAPQPAERAAVTEAGLAVECRGPVGWLIFDRPQAGNAMDAAMFAALPAAWRQLEEDPDVRAIVVTGRG